MRTSLMIGLSSELKDAIGLYAASQNKAVAEVVRAAIAKFIEYDLAAENKARVETRGRPKTYQDKTARRAAGRERRKAKRELAKKLLADFETQDARAQREEFRKAVEG